MRKAITLMFVIIVASSQMFTKAQTVTCSFCGGSGGFSTMAGFMTCMTCGGTGRMTDPNYANQQAYNWGRSVGMVVNGMTELAKGNDSEAVEQFQKALDLKNGDACYYLGICLELGMGLPVNHELAKKMQNLAQQLGSGDGRAALQRINSNGFLSATPAMRASFRQQVQAKLNGSRMNFELNHGSNSRSTGSRSCSNCRGTGRCTGCSGTGKVTSTSYYTDGHTIVSTCPVCKGNGRCGVCN